MDCKDLKAMFASLKTYEWIMIAIMILIAGYAMVTAFIDPASSKNPAWLTIANFVSAICGVVCIFFCAKAGVANFAFGLVNTIVYSIYLAYWSIYGTLCLELFIYLPVNIISWYLWSQKRDAKQPELTKSKRLTAKGAVIAALVSIASGLVYYQILVIVGGTVPLLDAYTVSLSIVAVFLQMFRYTEQYVLWLLVDIVAVAMFIIAFDPVYLTKKMIYLIMAFVGLRNWYQLHKTRNLANL